MRARAEVALIVVTIIWGTTFVLVKDALAQISTLSFLALRFSIAAVALIMIYRKSVRRIGLGPGLLAGCLLFTAYVFQTLGLERTTPSKSAFLTGLSIPMVPLASSLVYKTKPRLIEVIGILIATAGMILMTLGSSPAQTQWTIGRGDLLSFLCAVVFALHIVVIGHYSRLVGFESLAVLQIVTAAVASLVFAALAGPLNFHLTTPVVVAVLITGLLATALAFTTQAWAQEYTSATRAALIFSCEPVVAYLMSRALTGETMTNRGKVGAGAILAGILLVESIRSGRGPETNVAGMTS